MPKIMAQCPRADSTGKRFMDPMLPILSFLGYRVIITLEAQEGLR